MKLQHGKVIVMTSSGVPATLLIDGSTAHFTFNIPLDIASELTYNVPVESNLASNFLKLMKSYGTK